MFLPRLRVCPARARGFRYVVQSVGVGEKGGPGLFDLARAAPTEAIRRRGDDRSQRACRQVAHSERLDALEATTLLRKVMAENPCCGVHLSTKKEELKFVNRGARLLSQPSSGCSAGGAGPLLSRATRVSALFKHRVSGRGGPRKFLPQLVPAGLALRTSSSCCRILVEPLREEERQAWSG